MEKKTSKTHMNSDWKIGNTTIHGRCVLAPMEGITDLPFRIICRELGSAMSTTEFINAIEILNGHPYHIDQRLAYLEEERPLSVQIYDNDPERIIQSAHVVLKAKPDFIDINMGCSSKDVSGRGAGAGLLQTPEKIEAIFANLSKTLPIPVTGKIRLGWDDESKNYLEIAKIIEDNGGSSIAVHGRTRSQSYTGQADWDAIAEIKQAVSIPVIGNGDIKLAADIDRMFAHTQCDAVMIGRGAIGNPWIFAGKNRKEIPFEQVREMMLHHLDAMVNFYDERVGTMLFRKHTVNYLKVYHLEKEERRSLLTTETVSSYVAELDRLNLFERPFIEQQN